MFLKFKKSGSTWKIQELVFEILLNMGKLREFI
jgi:hypothetical protein